MRGVWTTFGVVTLSLRKDNDTDHGPNGRVAMVVGATGPRSALHLDSRSTGGVAATRPRRVEPARRSAASETPFWRTRPRLRRQRRKATQALRELRGPRKATRPRGRSGAARREVVGWAEGLRGAGGRLRGGGAPRRRGYAEREGGCAEGLRGGAARREVAQG